MLESPKKKDVVSKLLKEVTGRKIEKEISEMFRIGKKVEESSKPKLLLIKFESLETKNMVLDNSRRLKDSDSFSKVMLSLDLSKEDREDCKQLLADKLKEIYEKGGSKKWVVRIRGRPGPSMPLLTEEEQSNELTELEFFFVL